MIINVFYFIKIAINYNFDARFFILHVNNKLDNFYVLIKVLDNKYFLKNYLLYVRVCVCIYIYLFTCVHTLVYNIFISCDLL